jgi:hypothetical protein
MLQNLSAETTDIISREHRLMYEFHQKTLNGNLTEVRYIGILRNRMDCNKEIKSELILIKR